MIRTRRIPRKGDLLIAEPMLFDQNFNRTVIYMTEHTEEEGSVGFVLNKELDFYLQDLVSDLGTDTDHKIFYGGPVQTDSIYYVHRLGKIIPNSVPIRDDLYWGGDFDIVNDLIRSHKIEKDKIKFFLGYSGWSPGQLQQELIDKSWVVADSKRFDPIRMSSLQLWKEMLLELGDDYKIWSNSPRDPLLN
jgi:putative transcriptional regulator